MPILSPKRPRIRRPASVLIYPNEIIVDKPAVRVGHGRDIPKGSELGECGWCGSVIWVEPRWLTKLGGPSPRTHFTCDGCLTFPIRGDGIRLEIES